MAMCVLCKKTIPWEPATYSNEKGEQCCKKCYDKGKEEIKRREREKEAERRRKIYEHELSHCHSCGKKSSLYHYIFNRKTNKIEESWSNATDSENEIIFCTKEHFQTWLKQILKDREKLRQEKINLANKEKEELEEELRKMEEENNKVTKCSQCSNTWKVGEEFFYNNEKNDDKKFCSANCFQECYAENCDKCSKKIGMNDKSYYVDFKAKSGTLCESCWKIKKQGGQNHQPNQSPNTPSPEPEEEKNNKPTSTNSPTPPTNDSPNQSPNSPPNLPNHSPSPNNNPQKPPSNNPPPKITFSDSNSTQDKNFYKSLEEIKNSSREVALPSDISHKQRIFLITIQGIKLGKYTEENVNYDTLKLSESEKDELHNLLRELGLTDYDSREDISQSFFSRHKGKMIGGGIVIFGLIVLLIIIKKRKKIKKRSKS